MPEMPNLTVWTVAECARYIGVSASTWRSYVSRGDNGCPQPVARVGSTPVWSPESVMQWHRARPGKGGRRAAGMERPRRGAVDS